jgi:hypothetical protein
MQDDDDWRRRQKEKKKKKEKRKESNSRLGEEVVDSGEFFFSFRFSVREFCGFFSWFLCCFVGWWSMTISHTIPSG